MNMSLDQSIEQEFSKNLKDWKVHCRKNAMHSFSSPYLNCDAYRNLVKMGPKILPFIRDELKRECELDVKYENELNRIKLKVFGTKDVKLLYENYEKISQDNEYQSHACGYDKDIIGNPGIFWCDAIKEIVPEYGLSVGEKDSNSPVKRVAPGFVALSVGEVKKATIKWLDDNMYKYITQ